MIAQRVSKRTGDKRAQQERARRELARRSFKHFIRYVMPSYSMAGFHEAMVDDIQRWIDGEIRRLILTMPVRHGKSLTVAQLLPAFLLGRNPDHRVVSTSYAMKLAVKMGRQVRRIISSEAYQRIFPSVRMSNGRDGYVATADEFELVGRNGGYKCVGIGGGLTGHGFNYGIIDDPFADRKEAESEVERENVWDWYSSTFYTRQEPQGDAPILVMHTRWHEDDLVGRLLQQMVDGGADDWHVINFPALAIPDDPYRHPSDTRKEGEPLWWPMEKYEAFRSVQTPRDWQSIFQQAPAPPGGDIFQRDWFRYFHREGDVLSVEGSIIDPSAHRRFATVDLAYDEKTSDDYTVIASWVFNGEKLFLIDLVRERMQAPAFMDLVVSKCRQHRLHCCYVEDVGTQKGYVQLLQSRGAPVVGINPKRENKEARAYAAAPWFQQGRVYFPATSPWLADLEHEMLSFPNAAHDDQVDAIVYGVREAFGRSQGVKIVDVEPQKRLGVFDVGATGRSGVFG